MSLTCDCDYDPEPGAVMWEWSSDYSTLNTIRTRKCCSCGEVIQPGDLVAAFDRYKVPDCQAEWNIYGEDEWQGPSRATWYHCEPYADQMFNLQALGFCLSISDNMQDLLKEYVRDYGKGPLK